MENKEETEDEYFRRTGMFKMNFTIEGKITQEDMEKELVKEVEKTKMKAQDLKGFEKN